MKLFASYFIILLLWSCGYKATKSVSLTEIGPFKKLESVNLSNGNLYRLDSIKSKYIKTRPVDVWLPDEYTPAKKYAVMYMHDGQMLFDANTTWNKQEWKIDEVADQLNKDNTIRDFIVVAIHNIPKIRWQDLFPEKAITNANTQITDTLMASYMLDDFDISNLSGDDYLKFLVHELKPLVDVNFSVKTDKDNTFIAGSSMGGLMSMYAISEYPEVFSGAACLSTHWIGFKPSDNTILSKLIFDYVKQNVPSAKSHKLYFDYGTKTLDQYYLKYGPKVDSVYLNNGYTNKNFKNLKFEGEDHSENSWQKRINIPFKFLLKKH